MEKDTMDLSSEENTHNINVEVHNRQVNFQLPDSNFMKNIVLSIFQGKDYPILRLPKFIPNVIVDIGANIGATALYFHAAYPNAQIYCYEPSPRNFKYLRENSKYFNNIKTLPYGLYNKSCDRLIYFGKDQPAQDSIIKNNGVTENCELVKLVKVSEEIVKRKISRISILKLDTEGCEVSILNEFLLELANIDIDLIYVEYHSEEDRLSIDGMMSERFILFYSQTNQPHRGNKGFISKALISKYPELECLKIKRN